MANLITRTISDVTIEISGPTGSFIVPYRASTARVHVDGTEVVTQTATTGGLNRQAVHGLDLDEGYGKMTFDVPNVASTLTNLIGIFNTFVEKGDVNTIIMTSPATSMIFTMRNSVIKNLNEFELSTDGATEFLFCGDAVETSIQEG